MQGTKFFSGQEPFLEDINYLQSSLETHIKNRINELFFGIVWAQFSPTLTSGTPSNAYINVRPVIAYAPNGERIYVTSTQNVSIAALANGTYNVYARYESTEGTPIAHTVTGTFNNTRISDSFSIQVTSAAALDTDVKLGTVTVAAGVVSATSTDAITETEYLMMDLDSPEVTGLAIRQTNATYSDMIQIEQTSSTASGRALLINHAGISDAVIINRSNTGAGIALSIIHAGADEGIKVVQNGSGSGVFIRQNSNAISLNIDKTTSGSGNVIAISNVGTGAGINISHTAASNADCIAITQAANNDGIVISKTGTGAGTGITVNNAGTGISLDINKTNAGGGDILEIDDAGTGICLDINKTGASGTVIDINNAGNGNSLYINNNGNGVVAYFTQNGAATSVQIDQNSNYRALIINKSSSGAGSALEIDNDGTGSAINIIHNNTTNTGNAITITETVNTTTDRNSIYLDHSNSSSGRVASIRIRVQNAGSGDIDGIKILAATGPGSSNAAALAFVDDPDGGDVLATAVGNSGFVSNSKGTFTLVGFFKVRVYSDNTETTNTVYYVPYGAIA